MRSATTAVSAPPPPRPLDPKPPADTPTWKDGLYLIRARSSVANRFGPAALDASLQDPDSLRRSISARRPAAFGAAAVAAGDVQSKIHDILSAVDATAAVTNDAPEKAGQPDDGDEPGHAARKKGKMAKAWRKLFGAKSKKLHASDE